MATVLSHEQQGTSPPGGVATVTAVPHRELSHPNRGTLDSSMALPVTPVCSQHTCFILKALVPPRQASGWAVTPAWGPLGGQFREWQQL